MSRDFISSLAFPMSEVLEQPDTCWISELRVPLLDVY